MGEAKRYQSCPFCGATPHHGLGKVYRDQLRGEPLQDFSIKCPHGHAKITRPSEALARAEWNTRDPAQPPLGRDEIAEIIKDTISVDVDFEGADVIVDASKSADEICARLAALRAPEAADAGAVAWQYRFFCEDHWTQWFDCSEEFFDRIIRTGMSGYYKAEACPLYASPSDAGMRERAAIIEECAKIAETYVPFGKLKHEGTKAGIAAAIRALSAPVAGADAGMRAGLYLDDNDTGWLCAEVVGKVIVAKADDCTAVSKDLFEQWGWRVTSTESADSERAGDGLRRRFAAAMREDGAAEITSTERGTP
jgi:hypothetical protein